MAFLWVWVRVVLWWVGSGLGKKMGSMGEGGDDSGVVGVMTG